MQWNSRQKRTFVRFGVSMYVNFVAATNANFSLPLPSRIVRVSQWEPKLCNYKEIAAEKRDIQSKIDCLQEENSCAEENNRVLQARIALLEEEHQPDREHQSKEAKLKQSIMEQEFEIEQARKILSEGNAYFSKLETHGENCQNLLELYIEMEDSESLQLAEVFAKDDENKTKLSDHNIEIKLLEEIEQSHISLRKEREKELEELQHEFEALQKKLKHKKLSI